MQEEIDPEHAQAWAAEQTRLHKRGIGRTWESGHMLLTRLPHFTSTPQASGGGEL